MPAPARGLGCSGGGATGDGCSWRVPVIGRSGGFAQRELHDVDAALGERRFAVGEVELPDAQEALVETELQHALLLVQEGVAPDLQRARVVGPESELVDHLQTGALCLGAERARAWQAAAGKDVLLDEVGALD